MPTRTVKTATEKALVNKIQDETLAILRDIYESNLTEYNNIGVFTDSLKSILYRTQVIQNMILHIQANLPVSK